MGPGSDLLQFVQVAAGTLVLSVPDANLPGPVVAGTDLLQTVLGVPEENSFETALPHYILHDFQEETGAGLLGAVLGEM